MRKALIIFVACLAGALVALQVDHWIRGRYAGQDGIQVFGPGLGIRPASLDPALAPPDFRAAAKRILPSVVSINTLIEGRNWFGQEVVTTGGSGSGVVISADGYILTNNHVIQGGRRSGVADVVRVHTSDGKYRVANVIGADPRSDLAVLKIDAPNLAPAEFGKSADLQIGEWVVAAGSPLGLENTVSVGIVSNLGRSLPTPGSVMIDAIQTDAAINPGNSGGALANATGQLVGINTAIATNNQGSIGLGFAIPIDRAKKIVQDILKFGRARYGELGLQVYNDPAVLKIEQARAELESLTGAAPPSEGVLVQRVWRGTPAARAGIETYSVLLAIDGKKLSEPLDYMKSLADKRPGDKVRIEYWTRGERKTQTITLEDLIQT